METLQLPNTSSYNACVHTFYTAQAPTQNLIAKGALLTPTCRVQKNTWTKRPAANANAAGTGAKLQVKSPFGHLICIHWTHVGSHVSCISCQ